MSFPHIQVINLQTLTGTPLPVTVTEFTISDGHIATVIQLGFQDWRRALREGLFHLDEESEPVGFEADKLVVLTLRLRPAVAGLLADQEKDMAEGFSEPDSPLHHTEAWLATDIVQSVDVPPEVSSADSDTYLQMGARTRWAEPLLHEEQPSTNPNDVLEAFLDNEDWPFTRIEANLLRFPAGVGDQKSWVVVARIEEDEGLCTLFSVLMDKVPASSREQAALWMAQKNYELSEGCFEMDTNVGEVRFRSTFPATSQSQVAAGIHNNLSIMAAHFDALMVFT
jgi:hypothetical protein